MRFFRISALAALAAASVTLAAGHASASTVVADWTFSNDATGYSGGSVSSGVPLDSVGGHDFTNGFGDNTPGSGGSVGGPSSTSSSWDGNGGWYGAQAGSTTLPSNNFAVEVHASVGATSQGILFSSDGNLTGDLQIGEDASGHWVAYVSYNGNNYSSGSYSGIQVGQSAAIVTGANYDLQVTDIGNVFTFYVNGVATGAGVTPTSTFGGFGAVHIAVAPGGVGPNYSGLASDLTISTVPEPSSLVLLGIAATGLLAVAGRRRKA